MEVPKFTPEGWAVKLDGRISIRTASNEQRGAQINALVLYCGVDAYVTGNWTDDMIQHFWDQAVQVAKGKGFNLEIVPVICLERVNG